MSIDWINETAKRCHGKPDGWMWFRVNSYKKPDDFFECFGGIPIGVWKSGPRKGRTKWAPGPGELIWMRFSEVEETERIFAERNE